MRHKEIDDQQTPNHRCQFCGEGITCQHGNGCEMCCLDCRDDEDEDDFEPITL